MLMNKYTAENDSFKGSSNNNMLGASKNIAKWSQGAGQSQHLMNNQGRESQECTSIKEVVVQSSKASFSMKSAPIGVDSFKSSKCPAPFHQASPSSICGASPVSVKSNKTSSSENGDLKKRVHFSFGSSSTASQPDASSADAKMMVSSSSPDFYEHKHKQQTTQQTAGFGYSSCPTPENLDKKLQGFAAPVAAAVPSSAATAAAYQQQQQKQLDDKIRKLEVKLEIACEENQKLREAITKAYKIIKAKDEELKKDCSKKECGQRLADQAEVYEGLLKEERDATARKLTTALKVGGCYTLFLILWTMILYTVSKSKILGYRNDGATTAVQQLATNIENTEL